LAIELQDLMVIENNFEITLKYSRVTIKRKLYNLEIIISGIRSASENNITYHWLFNNPGFDNIRTFIFNFCDKLHTSVLVKHDFRDAEILRNLII